MNLSANIMNGAGWFSTDSGPLLAGVPGLPGNWEGLGQAFPNGSQNLAHNRRLGILDTDFDGYDCGYGEER